MVPLSAVFGTAVGLIWAESQLSLAQQYIGTRIADGTIGTEKVKTLPPANGERDKLLGYAQIQKDDETLRRKNFIVGEQQEWNRQSLLGLELYPHYNKKVQAGLEITDDRGDVLYGAKYPRTAPAFGDIHELWWKSLLYVENRERLDQHAPSKNMAVEWDRLALASVLRMVNQLGGMAGITLPKGPGASTLDMQTLKLIHGENAKTRGNKDKLRQIATAMVEYYRDPDPKKIIALYMGIVPMAATPVDGEVFGMYDAVDAWYGHNYDHVKAVLDKPEQTLDAEGLKYKARIYREVLSTIMALPQPTNYFHNKPISARNTPAEKRGREMLETRIDNHLPGLVRAGIISADFAALVKAERLQFLDQSARPRPELQSPHKFVNTLRTQLMQTMEIPSLYDLERRDLSAKTTLDGKVNRVIEKILNDITNPDYAKANGLTGARDLFDMNGTQHIKASFILYEIMPDGRSVMRAMVDNVGNEPLNLNSGIKLELGSTAKFRWGLLPYLMIMGELHDKYAAWTPGELSERLKKISMDDNHTRWALNYLLDPAADKSLDAMLNAALERKYSGSPAGTKVENFDRKENSWNVSVRKNFHHSVNAAFIRIMRDNANYVIYEKMGINADIYNNPDDPDRLKYLESFVKEEGTIFLWRAWEKQQGKTPEEIESMLVEGMKFKSPGQLAALFRDLHPEKTPQEMETFIRKYTPEKELQKLLARNVPAKASKSSKPRPDPFLTLYNSYAPGVYEKAQTERLNKKTGEVRKFDAVYDLNERSYKIKAHPLALWLAKYKVAHPDAKWSEIVEAAAKPDPVNGKSAFMQSYSWLFKPSRLAAQNRSLRNIVKQTAYTDYLLPQQQSLGYPFEKVIPDERTVLGSSGDTPEALSALMGVVQHDGVMVKPDIFWSIDRAEGTIYHRPASSVPDAGRILIRPEIAQNLRQELQGVVDEGTGVRLKRSRKNSITYIFGGKTGSGNNVVKKANGSVVKVLNRTATWTFIANSEDNSRRFYGTTLLYVEGAAAAKAHFTSAAAVTTTKLIFENPEVREGLSGETVLPAPMTPTPANESAPQKIIISQAEKPVLPTLGKKPAAIPN